MIHQQKTQDTPWLDFRLKKEEMSYLWNSIDHLPTIDAKGTLAGNISESRFIEDKDNWFFRSSLKELSEYMYYKDWNNYQNEHIAKVKPPAVFKLKKLWVNYQKQYEFNPPHDHNALFSFVVFMKIPTHWKEQHALPWSVNSNIPCASDFQFILPHPAHVRSAKVFNIPLSAEDEGRILFFHSWLTHQVFPFYGTFEPRITISGNIETI